MKKRESFRLLRQEVSGRWTQLVDTEDPREFNAAVAKEKARCPEATFEAWRRVESQIDHAFEPEPVPETGQLLCKVCGGPAKQLAHTGATSEEWVKELRAELGPSAWDQFQDVDAALREIRGEAKLWLPGESATQIESEDQLRAALTNGYSPAIPMDSWPSVSPVQQHLQPPGHRLQVSIAEGDGQSQE